MVQIEGARGRVVGVGASLIFNLCWWYRICRNNTIMYIMNGLNVNVIKDTKLKVEDADQ